MEFLSINLNTYRTLARNLPGMALFLFDHDLRCHLAEGITLLPLLNDSSSAEGKMFDDIMPPTIVSRLIPLFHAALRGQEQSINLLCHDHYYEFKAAPFRDDHNQLAGGVLTVQDISRYISSPQPIEQAIKESDNLARATINTLSTQIAIMDNAGNILTVNKAWRDFTALYGEQLSDWESLNFLIMCGLNSSPESVALVAGIQAVINEELEEYVSEYIAEIPAGKYYFLSRVRRIDPQRLVISYEDITALKQTEAALRESENRFRTIINSAVDAIYMKDTAGRYVMINPTLAHLFQRPTSEIIGKTDFELLSLPEAEKIQEIDRNILMGVPHTYEAWRDYPDYYGYFQTIKVPYIVDNKVVGLIGITRDITGRKRADEALQAAEERFRLIAHTTSDALFDYTTERGVIWRSEGFSRLMKLHIPVTETTIDWWFERIHPEDLPRVQAAFQEIQQNQRQDWQQEYRVRRDDDVYIHIEDHVYFIYDEAGQLKRFIGSMTDITPRKEAAQQTIALAMEKERVHILEGFITAISHDFRTPLSVINTSAYLLSHSDDTVKRASYQHRLLDQVAHLEKLVDSLLTVIQLERGAESFVPTAVDLYHTVDLLRVQTSHLASLKQQQVIVDVPQNLPPLLADEAQLMRALYHTMKNAIQYTPAGGAIYICASATPQEGIIEIRDTGIGIPADDLPRIFEPLFRGKLHEHRGDGQGLGLAIVQRIVTHHRGRVEVESMLDQGSAFRLFFPLFHAT